MTAKSIVRLKITLDLPNACFQRVAKPIVMRRTTVRFGIRLDRLHAVVQAAMGWSDSHLWEFRAGGAGWGPRNPDFDVGDGPLDAAKATLLHVLNDVGGKSIKYLYDFGDGWEHTIKVEKVFPDVPGLPQPFLLEATGRCPPEDIGGPPGYAEFLEAIADPKHDRHADYIERFGADFKPDMVNLKALEARVNAIAERTRDGAVLKRAKPPKP
jgi:hypothetical protein